MMLSIVLLLINNRMLWNESIFMRADLQFTLIYPKYEYVLVLKTLSSSVWVEFLPLSIILLLQPFCDCYECQSVAVLNMVRKKLDSNVSV